jgi:hypothetical protein
MPLVNGFFSKVNRKIAALPQRMIILRPIGNPILGFLYLMTTTLIVFVGHGSND